MTINEVSPHPIPIEQASPLAIALYELIENAVQHAFDDTTRANYLHIILTPEQSGQTKENYRLIVQDNGPGIPAHIDPLSAQTPGFVIVASMANRLGGELIYATENGTQVSLIFPRLESS